VIRVQEILRQAKYWAAESIQACRKESQGTETIHPVQRWQLPAEGTLKVNVDGAYWEETRRGGWGFIVHDETGAVGGSGAGRINHAASVLQTEATACMEAIQAAASWGMETIQVESDSAILVKALQCSEYDLAPEGVLSREMRIFIHLNFVSFKITHAGCVCNKAAHCLAAIGSNQNEVQLIWPDYVPDIVNVVVASELAEPV
jgi:ribonuclease HI